jgi:hypothetical protein
METLLIQSIDGEKFCNIPVQEMVSFYSLTKGHTALFGATQVQRMGHS